MTKKDRIIKMFESCDWLEMSGETWKIIHGDDFLKHDLNMWIEYGQTYCDVIYAKRIFQKMGYRVLVGSNMWIQKPDGN